MDAVEVEDPVPSRLGPSTAILGLPRVLVVPILTVAALMAIQVALVVHALGGPFVYTLDDPYIHLALADQIARGHYGLAAGSAAAPSSSILFPVLLAVLAPLGLGDVTPLALNAAATVATIALLAILVVEACPEIARWRVLPLAALSLLAASGLNLVGVALTGLEHAPHIALTLAWLLGASRFLRRGELTAWWWSTALLEPLIRYEGASLWLGTIVLLLARRRPRPAVALGLAGIAALGGFSLFLVSQGLSPLPSSVLVKSTTPLTLHFLPSLGPLSPILSGIVANLLRDDGMGFLAVVIALGVLILRAGRSAETRTEAALGRVALAASLAQLTFGRLDGYSRYEIYVLALDVAVLTMGFAPEIRRVGSRAGRMAWVAAVVMVLVLLPADVVRSLTAGGAARNIYEQQYQMHRLAAEFYRAPVAVNDLGQVSYRNPYPVLDLWGLGSEEARRARLGAPTSSWMRDLARRHGVGLAMIYADCFPAVPTDWVPVARLRLGSPRETAGEDAVTFYATGTDRIAAIDTALDHWAPTLPAGVHLDRLAVPPADS